MEFVRSSKDAESHWPLRFVRGIVGVVAAAAFLAVPVANVQAASETPSAPIEGSIGIKVIDPPPSNDPRANYYIVDTVEPGGTVRAKLFVVNESNKSWDVEMYPGPANATDKGWEMGEKGSTNDLTTWTSVTPKTMFLKPGESRVVDVTIKVPADASTGERYGVVWASTTNKGNVSVVSRVGVRQYIYVGKGGAPPASYTIDAVSGQRNAEGKPTVVATLTNTGKRVLQMSGKVFLTDGPGGTSSGPYDITGNLAIGQTGDFTALLPEDIPLGPWKATVKFDYLGNQQEKTGTITIPAGGSVAPAEPGSGPPWIFIAVGLLILLIVAAIIWLIRSRRKPPIEAVADPGDV